MTEPRSTVIPYTTTGAASSLRSIGELLPEVLPEPPKHSDKPRSHQWTWPRLRLLACVAERPGVTTADAALEADLSHARASRALAFMRGKGWIEAEAKGRSHRQEWRVTPPGLQELVSSASRRYAGLSMCTTLPGGHAHGQDGIATIGTLLESAERLTKRLEVLGWRRRLIERALRVHRLDFLLRRTREAERVPGIRNRGAFLRFLIFDPEARVKRLRGLASKVLAELSEEARRMFLHVTEKMPIGLALRLAFSLRKIHRRGRTVTAGDVSGMAGEIEKRDRSRSRPRLE